MTKACPEVGVSWSLVGDSLMSAPTMLELHDTQMSDYPSDIDVPMHSSSSEYWFHAEVTMEDDGHLLHTPKVLEHESTSVEVDMEPYDGERENTEYEMADEAGNYDLESGDLEDVDLYDASQVHSPAPVFQIDATDVPPINVTDDAYTSPSLLADTFTSAGTTMRDIDDEVNTAYEGALSNRIHNSAMETPVTLSPHPDIHLGNGFVYVDGHDLSSSHSDEQAAQEDTPSAVLQPVEATRVPVDLHTENLPDTAPDVHADDEVDTSAQRVGQGEDLEEPIEVPSVAQMVESIDHHQQGEYSNQDAEEQTGASDPHEISEGVYIDPPPAVLLSLPSDLVEVCLFNHPQSSSGSTTPSPEAAENADPTLMLFLHHRPTLYYEPLASVFDALRQEEYIAQIPGIADGELVLDAYDLHLSVSEDNIYAREVTLHDLNVIHDGTDMSGPLRLHLQSVMPRFIIRYHSLRDQIARLNLATEIGEDHTELVAEEEHAHEETSAQVATPEPTQEQIQNTELNDHQGQQPREQSEVEGTTESLEPSGEVIGDTSNFSTEGHEAEREATDPLGIHEVEGEDAHPLEDEIEYADVDDNARFERQETGEDLDADGIHDVPDTLALAPVSAEYEEYAELQGKDDGTHGEALSEDPGGQHALGHTKSEEHEESTVVDETLMILPDALGESTEVDPAESEVTYPLRERPDTGNEKDEGSIELAKWRQDEAYYVRDCINFPANELKYLELQNFVDESDSHSVAFLESENNIADSNNSEQHVTIINPEPYDEEWDDSLDGEGEPDINWEAEHDDMVSNESSITLSSSTSKRKHDEVDFEGEHLSLPGSPGLKRPRVE